jgi:hypothetical protein
MKYHSSHGELTKTSFGEDFSSMDSVGDANPADEKAMYTVSSPQMGFLGESLDEQQVVSILASYINHYFDTNSNMPGRRGIMAGEKEWYLWDPEKGTFTRWGSWVAGQNDLSQDEMAQMCMHNIESKGGTGQVQINDDPQSDGYWKPIFEISIDKSA